MSYQINTTNQPEGSPLVEVDDAEFIDLQRMGLIVPGKGDVNADGKLKKTVEAPDQVRIAAPSVQTGAQPTVQGAAA